MAHTPMHTARTRRRHAALLAGCALGLVLAAMPQAALAQDVNKGFQGVGTVDAGGAAIFTSDGGKTTAVNVGTPTAVITWKTDDQSASGTIDFLPDGHSALFGSTSQSDYTVLNRILPNGTANIGINGTITSSVANGRVQAPGGNVWFYTPNGFVIGPTAVIQVGGLVMTTNDITYSIDPASALPNFTDANGAINFRGPDGSKGSIVNNGSIVGNNANSYIALVAPRIEQHGFVSADRSIAYVAAEQVDLKINAGNFDILIGQGTADENGIVHDGTTTGAASTGSGDQKAMRFVAVPKNTALTMLLSGGIGYTPAASVFNDGSAVVLSADGGADGAPDGNIKIGAADFSNRLSAHATGDLTVAPTPPGPFDEGTSTTLFRSFTDLRGDKSVHVTAGGGTRIEALNSLTLTSDNAAGGGSVTVEAFPAGGFTPAGEVAVTGFLQADASHYGDVSDDGNDGLDSQGGTVTIAADGGQISADSMYLYAGGYGGFGNKTGGDGFGGQIDIRAGFGGGITAGYLSANAEGHGGGSYEFTETGATGGLGGVGTGGAITLTDSSGSVADDPTGGQLGLGSVYLNASAIGGNSLNSASGLGGDAFGGRIGIALDRQNQSFGFLDAHARAEDGDGGAVDPIGGDITMAIGGGIALALDSLHLDTGVYASINSPAGAFGRGGTIDVSVTDGASVTVTNDAELDSLAEISPFFGSATSSPDLTGGTISLIADGGSFQARNISVDVSAYNTGADVSAGIAKGGSATVRAANDGLIFAVGEPESIFSGQLSIDATGTGSNGLSANSVTGGDITLAAESGGTIAANSLFGIGLYADGNSVDTDNTAGNGVIAQGGSIAIDAIGGSIATELYAAASGYGGDADGNGGAGTGGSIAVRVMNGGELTGYFLPEVYGYGGASLVKGDGGDGRGGKITLVSDATAEFSDFSFDAYADAGGGSAASGLGGDGYGGGIEVDVLGGTHSWNFAFLTGRGEGGFSQGPGSVAGSGYGSVDGLTFSVGSGADLTLQDFIIDAGAAAGINGGAGAAGTGGSIAVAVTEGSSLVVVGNASLDSRAEIPEFGDAVTNSPDLTGGNVSLLADGGVFEANNILIDVSANNVGAEVTAGFAQGGDATVRASNGGAITALLTRFSEGDNGVLRVEAEGYGTGGASANLATGGNITLASETGATITAQSGTIELNARGEFGIASGGQAAGVTAQGGAIAIDALGGTIATGIFADAGAEGGDADNTAGSGTGGSIDVRVLGGTLVNSLFASANGSGGAATVAGNGGDGTGGRFTLTSDKDATFTDFGLTFYGDGRGGYAIDGTGGNGFGGSAQVDLVGGAHTWSSAYLSGQGFGASSVGPSSIAGSGAGSVDGINFHIGGGAILTLGYLDLDASASAGGDGDENEAAGGVAELLVDSLGKLTADGVSVNASGRLAYEDRDATGYNTTPDAGGGIASAIADNGTITTPFLAVTANGTTGGALATAGTASGGIATIGSSAGGLIDIVGGIEGSGGLTLEARGLGAEGPSAAHASGGIATLYTEGGTISSVFDIVVNANGEAGEFSNYFSEGGSANGYDAFGGTASLEMRTGGVGGAITAPSITVTADGLANQISSVFGNGGTGNGGIASLEVEQGTLTTGLITVTGDGFGGAAFERYDAGPAYASGSGEGGIVTFGLHGGTVHTTSIFVSASGTGASGFRGMSGATGSLPGTGLGGIAEFTATGGTLDDSGGVTVITHGTGGIGAYNPDAGPGGDGADGRGGISSFDASATASLGIAGPVRIAADGLGGFAGSSFDGTRGAGGNGDGGVASMTLADIAFELGAVEISATGGGGFGDTLGIGSGGISSFRLDDSLSTTLVSPRTIDSLFLGAAGFDARENLSVGGQARFVTNVNSPDAALTITNDLTLYADGLTGPAGLGAQIDISGADVTVGGALEVVTPRSALFSIASGDALNVTGNIDVLVGRALNSSGAISTAANARVIANNGITMTDLSAGGTTLLQAINGPVVISHDLRSTGPVTVLGQSVSIFSLGALSFADADATAGELSIETAGDLLLATADATGVVSLTSSGGSIHNTGAVNGVGIFYTAAGNVQSDATLASGGALGVDAGGTFSAPGTVSALGNVSLSADLGMALSGVISGGTTRLAAMSGPLSVGSLTSAGVVTADARSISIGSPGGLRFNRAQATAGDLNLTTAGNLVVTQGGASGAVNLTSTAGRVSGTGPIVSGGNSAVSANGDITLGTLTSGGTTSLASSNGAVDVTDLKSAGAVTASGLAVTIGSSGALTFSDLEASAGEIAVQTAGDLAVGTADATGAISLVSTGGAVGSSGAITAGGALAVSGDTGIAFSGATSSGAETTLAAANGAILLSDLTSAGDVTATGRSIDISSPGELTVAAATATVGDIVVRAAGSLLVGTADATGSIDFTSTGGSVGASGDVTAGEDVSVAAADAVAFGPLTSGGSTSLTAGGSLFIGNLVSAGPVTARGGNVAITSTGALSFADAQATDGSIDLTTAGDLALDQANAAGAIFLTSSGGAISATGPVEAGARVVADGFAGLAFGTLTSGADTVLTSSNGAISVGDLNSALGVSANGQSIDIDSSGALVFDALDATLGNVGVQTAGNLLVHNVSAPGSVTLASTGGSLETAKIDANGIALSSFDSLDITGDLTSAGAISLTSTNGTVQSVGAIAAGGDLGASAQGDILFNGTASSGGTTTLAAADGSVIVNDLLSAGLVTASGQSIVIGSTGALSFADAQANGGDLVLTTASDLAIAQGSATGAVNLTSTGGSVSGAGPIVSGGNAAISGHSGVALGTLTSGGTTLLASSSGAVTVTDLNSAALVTASGTSVGIGSSGALSFADLDATAGDVAVQTAGNLSVGTADATGSISLVSSGGALKAGGVLNGDGITLSSLANLALAGGLATPGAISLTSTSGSVTATGPVSAGGSLAVAGRTGIALGTAAAGGTTGLAATNGAIIVSDLNSAGMVTAIGRSIDIASTGALSFANARATVGALRLTTAGNLTVTQGGATGPLVLTSSGGTVRSTGSLVAGGNAAVSGRQGVTVASLTSGGTTALTSTNGAVAVSSLTSAGNVTATGRSVTIASPGALSFTSAQATAGNLNLATVDDLSIAQASATGALTLSSNSGTVSTSGPITAGGNTSIGGDTGVVLATLTSGGSTALTSASGAVGVTNLNSTGSVSASGRSVAIGSSGALSFADLDATAGDIAVQTAGNLALATADATGAVALTSTGGSVAASGPVAAGGNLAVSGDLGVALGTATSGGTVTLAATNGAVAASDLNATGAVTASGRSVTVGSSGALAFADLDATAGDIAVTTAGDLWLGTTDATGAIGLTSTGGGVSATGAMAAGGNLSVAGDTGIALGSAASGGTTSLASTNGAVDVANLNSAGPVTARGLSVAIGSSGALSFAHLDATAGDIAVQTANDLTVDGADATGSIALTSTGGLVTGTGPIIAGDGLAVAGQTGVTLGSATSGGATSLLAANGAVGITNLNSAGPVTASGRSITIGSSGAIAFGDLDATAGNIAVQTAGNLALGTVDASGSVTLTSTGGALLTGGAINGNGIALSSLASLQTSGLSTIGAISLTSANGSVTATGPVSAGGNVAATGQTGIAFGDLTSGGTTTLTAANGAVGVAALTSAGAVTATGRAIDLRGPGSLTIGNAQATAGDLILQAGQGLTVANASASGSAALSAGGNLATSGLVTAAGISLDATNVSVGGQVRSAGGLDVFASQLFALSGLATGTEIGITSGDIAIGSTGRLGSRGLTQSIVLRNRDAGDPMNIGGAGEEGQYSLDKDEAARLFADQQISFIAQTGEGGGGDVNIGDLALAFGTEANIGSGGLLKVDAGGEVTVNGAVVLTTVSDDDGFSIDPTRINVVAGDGSIAMRNSAGQLQGTLELQADNIAVADQATLDAIGALTDFKAISAALDTPGPAAPDGGYLQAGTINFIVGDSLFIQNGGATKEFDDRRGFLANALNIESESSTPRIAINGVIRSASGDLVGLDTSSAVSINGIFASELPSSVTVTINGCNAGIDCGRPPFSYNGLSSDDLELVLTGVEEGKSGPTGQLVQVQDNRPLITPPLVDEPITGVGNDDLWQVKCTPESDKGSCPVEEGTE